MDELPLSDLVVLDLTVARAGPTAVRQLADWGADVIRVEAPGAETLGRSTADHLNLHRNKRSMVLDLKTGAGREVLHDLVRRADVLVENMKPAVKHRLGFDWETLSALNPALVLGSISGFGQTGPYADRGGVDQIAQGLGGLMSVTGFPDGGPARAGVAISDVTAGLQLAVGILVALHERERTGRGRWVRTSLLESMIAMLDFQAARWTVDGELPGREGNHHPTMRPMGTYRTSDGLLNVAAPWGRLWRSFCTALGRPDLPSDPRFIDREARRANSDALDAIITEILSGGTTAEWVERLNEVGVPAGPVNDIAATFADPQVRHLGMEVPVDQPGRGTIRILRNATDIVGVSPEIRRPAPAPGEHTEEILRRLRSEG